MQYPYAIITLHFALACTCYSTLIYYILCLEISNLNCVIITGFFKVYCLWFSAIFQNYLILKPLIFEQCRIQSKAFWNFWKFLDLIKDLGLYLSAFNQKWTVRNCSIETSQSNRKSGQLSSKLSPEVFLGSRKWKMHFLLFGRHSGRSTNDAGQIEME